jgi:hypothetical protein
VNLKFFIAGNPLISERRSAMGAPPVRCARPKLDYVNFSSRNFRSQAEHVRDWLVDRTAGELDRSASSKRQEAISFSMVVSESVGGIASCAAKKCHMAGV